MIKHWTLNTDVCLPLSHSKRRIKTKNTRNNYTHFERKESQKARKSQEAIRLIGETSSKYNKTFFLNFSYLNSLKWFKLIIWCERDMLIFFLIFVEWLWNYKQLWNDEVDKINYITIQIICLQLSSRERFILSIAMSDEFIEESFHGFALVTWS